MTENMEKIISFECEEGEQTWYVTRSPDIRFGTNRSEALIFGFDEMVEAISSLKYIRFPYTKMVVSDA